MLYLFYSLYSFMVRIIFSRIIQDKYVTMMSKKRDDKNIDCFSKKLKISKRVMRIRSSILNVFFLTPHALQSTQLKSFRSTIDGAFIFISKTLCLNFFVFNIIGGVVYELWIAISDRSGFG